MLQKALKGGRGYWRLVGALAALILIGLFFYLRQLENGLTITGLSRDVTWGFYIAQFTFLVGVAASAVMVVLPYYLHDFKAFGRITVLGEFLAISAVIMCMLFIFVDMGQPQRVVNMFLFPTPGSVMFWDAVVLTGYLLLNAVIGWTTLGAERKGIHYPRWVKPLIYISIPWAVSIHTVTAFLYAGLPGRHLWLTAIMAPRFLASAFASGPALLIVLGFILKKFTSFDPGEAAFQMLSKIVTYAMLINVFFVLMEFFTAYYSGVPSHKHSLQYLYFGLEEHARLVPWIWVAVTLTTLSLLLLLVPKTRRNHTTLLIASLGIFFAAWIDKGLGLVVGGFVPNPLDRIVEYKPTGPEVLITLGVYAVGFLVLTVLYKVAVSAKEEAEA